MAAQLRPAMVDPERCEHTHTQNNHPLTVERGTQSMGGHFLRQAAVCLDCGARVIRVTEIVMFGAWRLERALFNRRGGR